MSNLTTSNFKLICKSFSKVYQISFNGVGDPEIFRKQLLEIKESNKDKHSILYVTCSLNHEMIKELENANSDIIDLFDEILGKNLIYIADMYDSMSSFMDDLDSIRNIVGNNIDKTYILNLDVNKGLIREINICTNGKVEIMSI